MIAPLVAASLIGVGGSLLGGMMASRNKPKAPEPPPEFLWNKQHGPAIWDSLSKYGNEMLTSKEGIPQHILDRMRGTAADSISGGYNQAQRSIDQRSAIAGLSPAGGDATRQRYAAGQMQAEQMSKVMSGIDIQDYMALEDKKNRGANLLFSLTNKSPVYSQIVAQNYWNELQAANENSAMWGNMIGGATANFSEYYMNKDMLNNFQQGNNQNQNSFYNPYGGQYGPQQNPYQGSGFDSRTPGDVMGRDSGQGRQG